MAYKLSPSTSMCFDGIVPSLRSAGLNAIDGVPLIPCALQNENEPRLVADSQDLNYGPSLPTWLVGVVRAFERGHGRPGGLQSEEPLPDVRRVSPHGEQFECIAILETCTVAVFFMLGLKCGHGGFERPFGLAHSACEAYPALHQLPIVATIPLCPSLLKLYANGSSVGVDGHEAEVAVRAARRVGQSPIQIRDGVSTNSNERIVVTGEHV